MPLIYGLIFKFIIVCIGYLIITKLDLKNNGGLRIEYLFLYSTLAEENI